MLLLRSNPYAFFNSEVLPMTPSQASFHPFLFPAWNKCPGEHLPAHRPVIKAGREPSRQRHITTGTVWIHFSKPQIDPISFLPQTAKTQQSKVGSQSCKKSWNHRKDPQGSPNPTPGSTQVHSEFTPHF